MSSAAQKWNLNTHGKLSGATVAKLTNAEHLKIRQGVLPVSMADVSILEGLLVVEIANWCVHRVTNTNGN